MAERFAASLGEFALDVETIDDAIEKAIARYEFPFRDGAETDDLGEKARTIKLRCYWLGERYAEHYRFIEFIKGRDLFELSHPQYGLLKGRIESLSIRHDDRIETAEVDLAFVQSLEDQEPGRVYANVQSAGEESFTLSVTEQMNRLELDLRAGMGVEAQGILGQALTAGQSILAQFPAVSLAARRVLKPVDAYVTMLENLLPTVTNPASSLLATLDLPVTLVGRIVGALALAVERQARAVDSLRSAPERYLASLRDALGTLASDSGTYAAHTRIAASRHLALEAGSLYQADESGRQIQRRAEAVRSIDALGNYTPPEPAPTVMSVRELERSLATVRAALQDAVDQARDQQALKAMARQLLDHVNQVKLERDRMQTIVLDNPMPLHLVCLRQGVSYRQASRLLAVNNIPHPNFTAGEVTVYGR